MWCGVQAWASPVVAITEYLEGGSEGGAQSSLGTSVKGNGLLIGPLCQGKQVS